MGGGDEAGVGAMLDRRHSDGDGEVGLAAPRLAGEDELRPDPTKSGARYGAMRSRRMPPLGAKAKSSTVLRKGKRAARISRWTRV
jgi:hypothetical protein